MAPKRRSGRIFESCDISLDNTPTSHSVSLALVICACCDSSMPLLSCTCLCNNSKWCLLSFVSPSSCTVVLLQCFLLNIYNSTLRHKVVGILSKEKDPSQQLCNIRVVGVFSRVSLFSEITVISCRITSYCS